MIPLECGDKRAPWASPSDGNEKLFGFVTEERKGFGRKKCVAWNATTTTTGIVPHTSNTVATKINDFIWQKTRGLFVIVTEYLLPFFFLRCNRND